LSGSSLVQASLENANLQQAILHESILANACLNSANLSRANGSRANFQGATFQNAIFEYTDFHKANFSKSNLQSAIFTGGDLQGVDLEGADLTGAILHFVALDDAHLVEAIFQRADLTESNLLKANFVGAYLQDTDLHRTLLGGTIFARNDLRTVKGLRTISHRDRSILDLNTVILPLGDIRTHLLQGVGFPNTLIDYYDALYTQPIQYPSCFISYSSKDKVFAQRLHADLQDQGVRCWFAPEDIKIGDKFRVRIDEAIHLQDKVLLLLSEHALQSTWVEDEVEAALEKEQCQQREVLFPVRLDDLVMQTSQAWAAKLRRTRHIGDFTCWTDQQEYQQAFKRLLRDLKANIQQ
jgi:uncharacterized protein YjbI with pentapeptide repeats